MAVKQCAELSELSGSIVLVADEEWVPFGLVGEERTAYAVLLSGVPPWLLEPLLNWLAPYLSERDGRGWAHVNRCLAIGAEVQIDFGLRAGDVYQMTTLNDVLRQLSPMELLRVVDYVLSTPQLMSEQAALSLEATLKAARSKYAVGRRLGRRGLVERVPAGVQDAVEGTIASAGAAGTVLARAWAQVHGLQPNDSGAYADAVRAAEIAAIAAVQPKKHDATLGTVLGQIKVDGDWRLPLREHAQAPGPETVMALIRTLWFGHRDRHGSVNYSDVSHDEARAAVALAATVVEWFTSGALVRRAQV